VFDVLHAAGVVASGDDQATAFEVQGGQHVAQEAKGMQGKGASADPRGRSEADPGSGSRRGLADDGEPSGEVIFNDSKVAKSQNPPKDLGYLYLYMREQ